MLHLDSISSRRTSIELLEVVAGTPEKSWHGLRAASRCNRMSNALVVSPPEGIRIFVVYRNCDLNAAIDREPHFCSVHFRSLVHVSYFTSNRKIGWLWPP